MNKTLFLSFLILIGCGKTSEVGIQKLVGESREFNQVSVDADSISRIQTMCQAISFKSDLLPSQVGRKLNMNFSTKSCEDSEVGPSSLLQLTIDQQQAGKFVYKKSDNSLFELPDLETLQSGLFSTICQDVNNLKSPIKSSQSGAMWISSPTTNSLCQSTSTELCLVVEKGAQEVTGNYTIHTTEVLKVKLVNPDRGFVTDRVMQSTSYCQKGFVMMRAKF